MSDDKRWLVKISFDSYGELLNYIVHAPTEASAKRIAAHHAQTYKITVRVVGERTGPVSEDHLVGEVIRDSTDDQLRAYLVSDQARADILDIVEGWEQEQKQLSRSTSPDRAAISQVAHRIRDQLRVPGTRDT